MTDLSTLSEEARHRAVRALQADEPEAHGALLAALTDASWRVRRAALEAIVASRRPERYVAALVEALRDELDAGRRNAAAEALARLGETARPALEAALRSEDPDVAKLAADALGTMGSVAAVPALVAAATAQEPNLRAAAVEALGRLPTDEARRALIAALEDPERLVRAAAASSLAEARVVLPLAALQPLLADRLLRRQGVLLLAGATEPGAEEALAAALLEPARSIREAGLAAVGRAFEAGRSLEEPLAARLRGDGAARARLAEGLTTGDAEIAAGAALLLGALGAALAAPSIAAAGADERVRPAAALALARLGSKAADGLVAALPSLPGEARLLAVEALGRARAGQAVTALAEVADEPHDEVLAVAAIDALASIGDEAAAEALVARLQLPAPIGPAVALALARRDAVRERAQRLVRERLEERPDPALVTLLAALGDGSDVPRLRASLAAPSAELRAAAVAGLAAIGDEAAGHAVLRALADEAAPVRLAAAVALSAPGLGGADATIALLAALGDEAQVVAAAAATALGRRGDAAAAPPLELRLQSFLSLGAWPSAVAALEALAALGGADRAALEPALRSPEIELRKAALRVASVDALELVLLALAAPRWDERATAVRSAARLALAAAPIDRARLVAALEALAAAETDEAVRQALATARAARGAA